jgi:REP element-mobilizing transposase RayT
MTQRFKRLSHPIYECKYHLVFCPKYRYRIFKDAIGECVRHQVYELCKQKGLFGNCRDRGHLCDSLPLPGVV